jgi:hypothetical protein
MQQKVISFSNLPKAKKVSRITSQPNKPAKYKESIPRYKLLVCDDKRRRKGKISLTPCVLLSISNSDAPSKERRTGHVRQEGEGEGCVCKKGRAVSRESLCRGKSAVWHASLRQVVW